MVLKKQGDFLFSAASICIVLLITLFSFSKTSAAEFSVEKKEGFSSYASLAKGVSLTNAPISAPSAVVFAKKGHSSRISIVSKFIQAALQTICVRYADLSGTNAAVQHFQPLRLHLALRILRI